MYFDCGRNLYILNVGGLRRFYKYEFKIVVSNIWKGLKLILKN
jgi:nitrogen regulatory protein PII-like uncharacterized protein